MLTATSLRIEGYLRQHRDGFLPLLHPRPALRPLELSFPQQSLQHTSIRVQAVDGTQKNTRACSVLQQGHAAQRRSYEQSCIHNQQRDACSVSSSQDWQASWQIRLSEQGNHHQHHQHHHHHQQQQQQQQQHEEGQASSQRSLFRHQSSWRPLPPNQQEDAHAEQKQELGKAIQAAHDLASLSDLVHTHMGHPVLDALHIALALTQVRRLLGADSRYAKRRHAMQQPQAPFSVPAARSSAAQAPDRRAWAQPQQPVPGPAGAAHLAQAARVRRQREEAARLHAVKTIDLVLDASVPLLPSFGTAETTASLHALARLHVHTAPSWSAAFLDHARSLMPRFTLQQLCTLAWSLGTLGLDPGPAWLDDLCLATAARLEAGRLAGSPLCSPPGALTSTGPGPGGPDACAGSVACGEGEVRLGSHDLAALLDQPVADSLDSVTCAGVTPGCFAPSSSSSSSCCAALLPGSRTEGERGGESLQLSSCLPPSSEAVVSQQQGGPWAAASTVHSSSVGLMRPSSAPQAGTAVDGVSSGSGGAGGGSGGVAAGAGGETHRPLLSTKAHPEGADHGWTSMRRQASLDLLQPLPPPPSSLGPSTGTPAAENLTSPEDVHVCCREPHQPYLLVNMAWGLARLQHNVPQAWVAAYHRTLYPSWHRLRPHALSNAAWAAAVLGMDAGAADVQAYCDACLGRMHRANAFDLSTILWSLAVREVRPPAQWMYHFLAAALHALPSAEPRHVARMLWALAKLKWRPSASWAARVFQQTELQAFEFDGPACSLMLWAVSSLGLRPPTEWLEMMLVAVFEGGMADYGPQELTNLLVALGRLRFAPEYAWMDLFWGVSFYKLSQFKPQELVCALSAAVKVGHHPPSDWLAVYLKVVGHIMLHGIASHEGAEGRERLLSSRGALPRRLAKEQRWLGEVGEEPLLNLQGYARILTSLAALEYAPSKRWMAAFFSATRPLLSSWQEAHGSKAGHSSTEGSMIEGRHAHQQHVSSKCGLVFEGLLSSLAELHVQPPEDWLKAFYDTSLPHLPQMHRRNLDGLAYGVAVLELRPCPDWACALVNAIEHELSQAQALGQKVDRTSLGKSLFGIHWLEGPDSPVYQRWRDADWIGSALELYAYKRRPPLGTRSRAATE